MFFIRLFQTGRKYITDLQHLISGIPMTCFHLSVSPIFRSPHLLHSLSHLLFPGLSAPVSGHVLSITVRSIKEVYFCIHAVTPQSDFCYSALLIYWCLNRHVSTYFLNNSKIILFKVLINVHFELFTLISTDVSFTKPITFFIKPNICV